MLQSLLDLFGISTPTSRGPVFRAVINHSNVSLATLLDSSNEDVVDTKLHIPKDVTKLARGVVTTESDSGCHHWGVYISQPPDGFTGPRNHTL